ncbi:hypothetical protein [Streptomyces sp. NPDC007369]|uniref:hypothetical protein n=1 Tax=Streptomyces sp. NPDC007369 TaxID=3154589 RepID=UPI0033DCC589
MTTAAVPLVPAEHDRGHQPDPAPGAERQVLIERWAQRHGIDAARRLAEAEDLADAVAAEITPDNTLDTYAKSWRVWTRSAPTPASRSWRAPGEPWWRS